MNSPRQTRHATRCVTVEAPARLHLGFLDVSGSRGRRFGSLGLCLDGISTRVEARFAPSFQAHGSEAQRVLGHLQQLQQQLGLPQPIAISVTETIPAHAGLGSGTQLALAVGCAAAQLAGLSVPTRDLARWLDRGNRSGIGVGAFEQGGFLVDGGRGAGGDTPPIVSRLPFPDDWRIVLVLDEATRGLHGSAEVAAFHALPPFAAERAAQLCHSVLMQALPALAEGDLSTFGVSISDLQRVVGDYFAPAQGARFTSARVGEVLAWFEAQGVACVGQSSWGPTGFGIVASETFAQQLVEAARLRWANCSALQFRVLRGRNRGATLTVDTDISTTV